MARKGHYQEKAFCLSCAVVFYFSILNLISQILCRAIYFSVYAKTKKNLRTSGIVHKDSKLVPLCAGAAAGKSLIYA